MIRYQNITNMRIILFFAIVFAGCASLKVETLYDKKADFNAYKTWCWLECDLVYQGPKHLKDTVLLDNIANSIAVEMYEKGFEQTDGEADLLVDFHIIIKEDSAYFTHFGANGADFDFWAPYREDFFHFIEGSLVIDVIDKDKSQVIWRTNAKRLFSYGEEIDRGEVQKGIKKAMKDFPPQIIQSPGQ